MNQTRISGTQISVILVVSSPHNVNHISYDKIPSFCNLFLSSTAWFSKCVCCVFLFTLHWQSLILFTKLSATFFFHDTYFVKILQTTEYIATGTNHLLSMTHNTTKCLSHVSALMKRSIVWADSIKEIRIIFCQ